MYRILRFLLVFHLSWAVDTQCNSDDLPKSVKVTRGWNGNPRFVIGADLDQENCHANRYVASDYSETKSNQCDLKLGRCFGSTLTGYFTGYNNQPRVVLDNVIGQEICDRLIKLNAKAGRLGDGYPKKMQKNYGSPYTDREDFRAVSLDELVVRKKSGDSTVSKGDVGILQVLTDFILKQVNAIYGRQDLEIDYVYLVCRKVVNENRKIVETDFSHPVHSDNCEIKPDGKCEPFTYNANLYIRNVSAVLYLNGDFEGGEFYFANRPTKFVESVVKPACGRLVAFDAGDYHGVNAIKKGRRCAVAMWFKSHIEPTVS